MSSNYLIKISSIDENNFYCPGCNTFSDYVTKRGISTQIHDDEEYVDLESLVTQNDLTSTALENTNSYHSNFTKNNDTVCRGIMKTNLNLCGDLAGWVSLPLYTN